MIRRITLENYMSHARTEIEPAAGLTVLIGPNNCGKSAVVSALMTLCGENAGDFMVRHGEKVCRITVETQEPPAPDGSPISHTITWQRKQKAVSYTINGREIARSGKGNLPDDLQQVLRLPSVVSAAKDEAYRVHFGLQKEPIFLIDSESKTAAFFSSSVEAEHLLEMQRLHRQKVQTARTECRNTEADLDRLQKRLESLSPLDQLEPELKSLEAEQQRLTAEQEEIARLQKRIERMDAEQSRVQHWTALVAIYADCCPPPPVQDWQPLARLIDRTVRLTTDVSRHTASSQAMAVLQPPPVLGDEAKLLGTCQRIAAAGVQRQIEQQRLEALAPLAPPPVPHDLKAIQQVGLQLRLASDRAAAARQAMEALAALQPPPLVPDVQPLATSLQRFEKSHHAVEQRKTAAAAAEAQLAEVQRQIIEFVMANPLCPTCGGPIAADRLMHHGGGHEH